MRLRFWLPVLALGLAGGAQAATPVDPLLQKALADPHRNPTYAARDSSRHPAEELAFFGVKSTSTVVEIWPAGGYWTEFLAPYLRDHGKYYAAVPPPGPNPSAQAVPNFWQKLAADQPNYGKAELTVFGRDHFDMVPPLPGHADFVLTFRNYHDWMRDGFGEQSLRAFYKALKPGGILGIEDHRGNKTLPQDPKAANGYIRQDVMIRLAKQAGFEFVASSEIDANPRDTADWPQGVWSLPPTFREGEVNKAKYTDIGEADNFVLKFRKPVK